MPQVETDHITVAHPDQVVLDRLSVQIPGAAMTALVGPNGSGKSTLLRAVADLHRPQSGSVRLDGRVVTRLSPRELARHLSFLPQSPLVPDGITVRDLVGFGRFPHRGRFGRADEDDADAVAWAMEITSCAALADRRVETLSGGERQRAWIALALAQRTGLLLLDEPTTYLDIRYQVEVLDLLHDLVRSHGLTVVVVLHDLNQAAAYADHMLLLHEGRVTAQGTPDAVLSTEAVSAVFGIDVEVSPDPLTGAPTCHFYRRATLAR
jgi:ABC-type cobalamin/Fe3+-siderophores transport system ATPase subunit